MKNLKLKDFPLSERPREKMIRSGVHALSNVELLAVILRTGSTRENVIDLCRRMLKKDSIKELASKKVNKLKKIFGIGETKACQIVACFELARRVASHTAPGKIRIDSAQDVIRLLQPQLAHLKQEHVIGLFLDARKQLIKEETIFIGTLDSTVIHPREIFSRAIAEGASAVILAHNHPSNDPEPSEDDIIITKQLVEAGEIIGIDVLDHIIITEEKCVSIKDRTSLFR